MADNPILAAELREKAGSASIELTEVELQSLRFLNLKEEKAGFSYPADWQSIMILKFARAFCPEIIEGFPTTPQGAN